MGLFDFFKKKKKPQKPEKIEKAEKKKKKKKEIKKVPKIKPEKPVKKAKPIKEVPKRPAEVKLQRTQRKVKLGEGYRILKVPHVTEKATELIEENKYVFKVWPRANKVAVKEVIENIYGVDVIGVKIINIPKKQRRLGRQKGWRKGYKKAIVKIKKGQKIEILPR